MEKIWSQLGSPEVDRPGKTVAPHALRALMLARLLAAQVFLIEKNLLSYFSFSQGFALR